MNTPDDMRTDHINHDTLDNRKSNLRICTHAENVKNTCKRGGTSKYKGVYFRRNKWEASIGSNYKSHRLGRFDSEELAALAYNEAAIKFCGEFASLNEVNRKHG